MPHHVAGIVSDFPIIEVIKNRLYFTCFTKLPINQPGIQYVCTDRTLVYWNFMLDFGPMNLGQTYRFCQMMDNKLEQNPDDKIVYYCAGGHGQRRANSVMLICLYQMWRLNRSAAEAWRAFAGQFSLPPFHDATPVHCSYDLTVYDCLQGMERAMSLGFFSYDKFDVEEYEHFEKVESGDLSWVFPGKFVAFAGPHEQKSLDECYPKCVPEDYVPHFLERKVGLVVRLNKKYYDERRFTKHGIDHVELYYPDGSNPSDEILERFLTICESRPADESIAVHCKAGLGRTGTCIGAYAMKHWGFTSKEVIGWMRLARPGSVIGPQQQYMDSIQDMLHRGLRAAPVPHHPRKISAPTAVTPATFEENDNTQGDFLINAKISSPHSPAHLGNRKTILSSDAISSPEQQSPSSSYSSPLLSFRMSVARKFYGK